MKQKLLAMLLLGVMAITSAFAQTRTVTGRVTDATDGLPLPGVSVRVKGSNVGTTTNSEGSFSIGVPAGSTVLSFSYLGYTAREMNIPASGSMTVKLESDAKQLSEVVVTGYGVQK